MLVICIVALILSILSILLSSFVGWLLLSRFNKALQQTKELENIDSKNLDFSSMFSNLMNNINGGNDDETGKD